MKKMTTIARKIAGRTYSVDVPAFDRKGEVAVADDDLHRAELAIAAGIAQDGAISADGFRFMRKAMPLTAAELGRLITVSPETISRWENGVRDIDPLAFIALGDLVLEAAHKPIDARARMQRIADGYKPPKERRVDT